MAGWIILPMLASLLLCQVSADFLDEGNVTDVMDTTTGMLPSVTTPGKPNITTFCDFESGICGWTQDSNDTLDWGRNSGETDSTYTGPTVDHTKGTAQGHYMYIEASKPAKAGDHATLNYMLPSAVSSGCFSMYYHMYGTAIRTLKLESVSSNGKREVLWTKSGDQQNVWRKMNLTNLNQATLISITAVVGDTYRGDIAIDDVYLSTEPCPIKAINCTFDSGLCGWKQESADDFDWLARSDRTSSPSTGPDGTRNGTGRYLYIEATNKYQGDDATLSYVFENPIDTGCFSLYYHMYGASIGSLYVSDGNGNKLWSLSRNQGNKWHPLNLPITKETHKLSITAVAGGDFAADIAIDDVSFTSNSCPGGIATFGQCPKDVELIADPSTGTAKFSPYADKSSLHEISLPIGRYPYKFRLSAGQQCATTITVFASSVVQMLEFEVRYQADCSVLSNTVTKSMVMNSAQGQRSFVQRFCGSDCSVSAPEVSCSDNVLVVRYPTQTTYPADTTSVPLTLETPLTKRILISGKRILRMTITTHSPPIIYPIINKDGSAARVVLEPHCTGGHTYNKEKVTCE